MNKMMFLTIFLTFTSQVFAGNRIDELKKQMPLATPYEIFQQAFTESKDAIDLKEIGTPGLKCIGQIAGTKELIENGLKIFKSNKIGSTETKEFALLEEYWTTTAGWDILYNILEVDNMSTQLLVMINEEWQRYSMYIRKNGDVITYSMSVMDLYDRQDTNVYGYCTTK